MHTLYRPLALGLSVALLGFTANTNASNAPDKHGVGYEVSDFPQLQGMIDEAHSQGISITDQEMKNWLDSVEDRFALYIDNKDGISKLSSEDMQAYYDAVYDDFALFISEVEPEKSIKGYPTNKEAFMNSLSSYLDSATPPSKDQVTNGIDQIPDTLGEFLSTAETPN